MLFILASLLQFHGISSSKNKIEKRYKQAKEEIQIRKLASEGAEEAAGKLLAVQEKTAQPFIVLSGKGVKETMQVAAGVSAANKAAAKALYGKPPKPGAAGGAGKKGGASANDGGFGGLLGGGLTPLTGDRKVEAMYGIKKPSFSQ